MATVPLSGTNIRLLSGIPFANDYKHTRWFDTIGLQNAYFQSRTVVHSMTEANFQRIEGKHFIAVNKSIDDLWGVNYLMFQNAQYNGKWFYAFVTKLEFVQRNTTYVHFEIDVFQTWKFDMTFKPSYVVREHCPLWNADGTPVVNTLDEGLDYGSEYDIVGARQFAPNNGYLFLVIVTKSTLHIPTGKTSANYIKSSVNGGAQPLCYYFHPFDAFGQSPKIGVNSIAHDLPSVIELLNSIYSQTTAVNNIVSMYITDHIGIRFTYSSPTLVAETTMFQDLEVVDVAASGSPPLKTVCVNNINAYSTSTVSCGLKYLDFGGIFGGSHWTFPNVDESKLLLYPYAFTILDDFKGNRIVLKNEYISGNTLDVDVMGSMGISNKVAYIPKNYLTESLSSSIDRTSVGIEKGLIDTQPHDVPIINDLLAAFFQGNKNSLMNQANTIAFNGLVGMVDGLISGVASAAMRNPAGVAGSGVNVVKGGGNAVLQLQGLQAKIQDINNQPPSLSKMGSNTAFDYGNGYYGFWAISKRIKPEYKRKLESFFKMYGYKVNEVKMPNFHTRLYWNYVQTNSCNINGSFNNEDLQELKNIFDNGITFWHTDDVGNYSYTNGVIT